MELYNLPKKINHRKKRKGQGVGTGLGKTAGRGHKGQKSRAGSGIPINFEGGQMPLFRTVPKKGFKNTRGAQIYEVINIKELNKFKKEKEWDYITFYKKKLIGGNVKKIKILGNGELKYPLIISANKFSKSAKQKIEKAGGRCIAI